MQIGSAFARTVISTPISTRSHGLPTAPHWLRDVWTAPYTSGRRAQESVGSSRVRTMRLCAPWLGARTVKLSHQHRRMVLCGCGNENQVGTSNG
jgi:hypothetical protein